MWWHTAKAPALGKVEAGSPGVQGNLQLVQVKLSGKGRKRKKRDSKENSGGFNFCLA